MNLRFVCAQPANNYYLWQVEVLINNFLKFNVNPNKIDILLGINNGHVPEEWRKLQQHYNTVRFFFYNDTREDLRYIPSIYFNLVKQHLAQHKELQDEVLLLHDSDIIFTKPFENWSELTHGDTWWVADTTSYINYQYIKSKGGTTYQDMCDIVGIDWRIPKLMSGGSGGAQYVIKKATPELFDKIEKDSIKLYKYFCEVEHLYEKKHPSDYPIQKWTAGMWSFLWNAWLEGHETRVNKQLGFSWSTDNINHIDKFTFLHNAGVTSDSKDLFFKGAYTDRLPYNEELQIDNTKCSSIYWKEICEVSKVSPLLTNGI